jgi:hypothetical protein
MKTVNIKGKEYVPVNERIKFFRTTHPSLSIVSEILSDDNEKVVISAKIIDSEGRVLATGHAYEIKGSSFINKTSYIENCETSAWGRALGCFGIGIDNSIASSNEVRTAIEQQNKSGETSQQPTDSDFGF